MSSINVNLIIDRPRNHFTNLDELTGKVVLRTTSSQNVNSIQVKLEGESRTRLLGQPHPERKDKEKPKPVLEVHKLLYKVQVVFPPHNLMDETWTQRSYTIPPGLHEYPFTFKVPFNNACNLANSLQTNSGFMGLSLEVAKQPTQHVKTTLPPTVYFPGEAEIKYYVKCTVKRPQLLQQNPRAVVPFNFFPIEPPRPATDGEAYARRQHQFRPATESSFSSGKKSIGNMFRSPSSPTPTPTSPNADEASSPRFSIDARLPNPSIVTCNKDLPLRIILKKLSEGDQQVFLQSLQVELIGYTYVRAHEVQRRESSSWVLVSLANMASPIGSPSDPVGTETPIDPSTWKTRPLPNTVAPSFVTCNLRREYELEVRVGLSYGGIDKSTQSQTTILPLRLPLKVFSGIRPPQALLDAMNITSANAVSASEKPPLGEGTSTAEGAPAAPSYEAEYDPTPTAPGSSYLFSTGAKPQPPAASPAARPPAAAAAAAAPGYDEAPPSYEDAIASDMPAVDGPRPEYEPPPAPGGEGELQSGGRDEKRRFFRS